MLHAALKSEIAALAKDKNIEPEALLAIMEVESGGKLGSQINGRSEPLIRFEGHYFYRLLPARKRNLALVRGLAHPKAGKVRNPASQRKRWKLLRRAERIDREAALSSVSWGVGQVMGDHWRWLGYASIDALVWEARDGVSGQVKLMMRYIEKAGLIETLQAHDWAGFARRYNGPAYRRNRYDTKIRAAYHRYKGNKPPLPRANIPLMLGYGTAGPAVRSLQEDLSRLGFTLVPDGDFGPATERAVRNFQRLHGLAVDGIAGPKTFEAIRRQLPPAESPAHNLFSLFRAFTQLYRAYKAFTKA